jgi:hypothetical protein
MVQELETTRQIEVVGFKELDAWFEKYNRDTALPFQGNGISVETSTRDWLVVIVDADHPRFMQAGQEMSCFGDGVMCVRFPDGEEEVYEDHGDRAVITRIIYKPLLTKKDKAELEGMIPGIGKLF